MFAADRPEVIRRLIRLREGIPPVASHAQGFRDLDALIEAVASEVPPTWADAADALEAWRRGWRARRGSGRSASPRMCEGHGRQADGPPYRAAHRDTRRPRLHDDQAADMTAAENARDADIEWRASLQRLLEPFVTLGSRWNRVDHARLHALTSGRPIEWLDARLTRQEGALYDNAVGTLVILTDRVIVEAEFGAGTEGNRAGTFSATVTPRAWITGLSVAADRMPPTELQMWDRAESDPGAYWPEVAAVTATYLHREPLALPLTGTVPRHAADIIGRLTEDLSRTVR